MHRGSEISGFEKDAGNADTPHTLDKRVLLRGVDDGRPMADLISRKKVTKMMGHKLAALVSDNHMGNEFVGKAHVGAHVS